MPTLKRLISCFPDMPSPNEMKWNESGFRPPLCTNRINWARRTSWGWWDDWDDTVLQTQDSKFEPWRSEAEHATSRSRRLPTILTFTRGWGRNMFDLLHGQIAETGNRTPNSGVKGSGANHYPRAPALCPFQTVIMPGACTIHCTHVCMKPYCGCHYLYFSSLQFIEYLVYKGAYNMLHHTDYFAD